MKFNNPITENFFFIIMSMAALFSAACGILPGSQTSSTVKTPAASDNKTIKATDNSVSPEANPVRNVEAQTSAYEKAFNKLRGAGSYHFTLKTDGLPGSSNADTHIVANGIYQAPTRAWQYVVTGTVNQEWLKINSTSKNYLKKNGAWTNPGLAMDFTDASVDLIQGFFAPSRPDMGRAALPGAVGTETINGQECEHYHFTAPPGNMFAGAYDAYLSKSSNEFLRFDSLDKINKYSLSIDNLNAPVSIPAPAE